MKKTTWRWLHVLLAALLLLTSLPGPAVASTPAPAARPGGSFEGVSVETAGGAVKLGELGELLVPSGALASPARFAWHGVELRLASGLYRLHPIGQPLRLEARHGDGSFVGRLQRAATLRLKLDRPGIGSLEGKTPRIVALTPEGWQPLLSTYDSPSSTVAVELLDLPATLAVVDEARAPVAADWDPKDPAAVQLPDGVWGVAYVDGSTPPNLLYRRTLGSGSSVLWLDPLTVDTNADSPAIVRLGSTTALLYRKLAGTYRQVFLRTTTDDGATWSAPVQLTNESVDVYQIQATSAEGTAYVFWSLADTSGLLQYVTSADFVSWTPKASVGRSIGPLRDSTFPQFDVKRLASGTWGLVWLHYALVDETPGSAYNYIYPVVWYASSADLASWSASQQLTLPYSERWPSGLSLAQGSAGTVYLSFTLYDHPWDGYVFYRTSDDDGGTWAGKVIYGYEPSRPTDGWQEVTAANSYLVVGSSGSIRSFWDQFAGAQGGPDTYPVQLFFRDLPAGAITPIPPTKDTRTLCGPCVPTAAFRADPVNTATGNFTLPETDVSIPGRGPGLGFARTYNTTLPLDGPLGFGWTHSYDTRLVAHPTGEVVIVDGSGRYDLYLPKVGGGYTAPPGRFTTLVHEADGTWTLAEQNQARRSYSAEGKLASIADRNGNALTLAYDPTGRLATVTDPTGRSLAFGYTEGRITSLSDPLNRVVQYGYSPAGDLTTVIDPRGKVWSYTYDSAHRMLTKVDPNSRTVLTNSYGTLGRVRSQWDAKQGETRFEYYAGSSKVIDPRGAYTTYYFDPKYRATQIKDAFGRDVYQYWDGQDNLTRIEDRRNSTIDNTYFTYDPMGNVLTRKNGLNHTWTYTYNGFGDVLTVTDPLSHVTTYGYDPTGNLTTVTNAKQETTTFGRGSYGELTTLTDARGKVTSFGYDAYGQQRTATNPEGETWTTERDLAGRKLAVVDPLGQTTSFGYDPTDNLTAVTDARGKVTSYSYDDAGNRLTATDPNGKVTTYGYDEKDRLTTVRDAANQTTTYAYDPNDNLIGLTDANGHARSWSYDLLNRVQTETDALGKVTRYEYDGAGNRTKRTDANGVVTTYGYDTIGRLTTIDYPSGYVSYGYNAANLRTWLEDSTGRTTYGYDELNRLTTVTFPGNRVVSYGYDQVGNRTRVTYPDAKAVEYAYDDAYRLSTVTDWLGQVTTYGYDSAGRLATTSLPNGVVETRGYNPASQLTSLSADRGGTILTSFTYSLDDAGIRAAVQDLQGTESYSYDNLYRLTGATYADQTTQGYGYDAVGNRLTKSENGTPTSYSYDNADRLTAAGAVGYGYDANGNQTTRTVGSVTTRYCYDPENRLVEARPEGSCSFRVRVNSGGGRYVAASSAQWFEDRWYSGGYTTSTPWAIAGTTDDALYQNIRYSSSFGYSIPVPNGDYTVTLKFAEIVKSGPGQRTFNVAIEGTTVLQNFDVYAEAGGKFIALDRSFVATVTDGTLNVQFSGVVYFAMVSAIEVASAASNPEPSVSYRYSEGLRVGKTASGQATTYTWDVSAGLPVILQDGSYSYVYGLGLISQTDNSGGQSYFLGNGLGSTEVLADGQGSVVATYKYDVFGNLRSSTGPGSTEYQYTGEQHDPTLGYTYLRARYYDPSTGRFTTKDPFPGIATNPGTLNPYAYTLNSPTNATDPSGEVAWWLVGAGVGAIVGGGVYAATHWDQVRQGDIDWVEAGAYVGGGALAGSGVGLLAKAAGAGTAAGTVAVAANPNTVQRARDVGLAAQRTVQNANNTKHILSLTKTAKYRVPDILNKTTIGDVKCSNYVRLTSQLRDDLLWAQQDKLQMELHVKETTRFSSGLRRLVDSGLITRINDLD